MQKTNYSSLSKAMHRLYLGNYFVAKTSFDIEQTLYRKTIQNFQVKQQVFVSGLARAGTTALFNAIYQSGEFASLKYSNMPFLLMPIIGNQIAKNKKATALTERAHGDGILVNSESPEAFDEYFWKANLVDSYIHPHHLSKHQIDSELLVDYENYIKAICIAEQKKNYLSKNNNNVLRISSLLSQFPSAKLLLIYRNPIDHAQSLLKQHQYFSALQKEDSFSLLYFNYLGHHEFGLNHKPFQLLEEKNWYCNPNQINYWLWIWYQYYAYILEIDNPVIKFIGFEDYCSFPEIVSDYLNQELDVENVIQIKERFQSKPYAITALDEELKKRCMDIYETLQQKRKYIKTNEQ